MDAVLALLVLFAVIAIVAAPLRRAHAERRRDERGERIENLEAVREAKYREIRDAELDHRTGKLSESDYEALDASLRAEALAVLDELNELRAAGAAQPRTTDA